MKSFKYTKSVQIINWGCSFDSLLELKYAISIRDDYEFLRAHIPIYYDPQTKIPTNYLRTNIRRYTPDFLVRHKETKKALWVELKPRAFEKNDQLVIRQQVAERYIKWKGYDWVFKIIYDDEIKLNAEQQKQFLDCCRLIPLSTRKLLFEGLNKKFDRCKPSLFKSVPRNAQVHFVMFGESRQQRW